LQSCNPENTTSSTFNFHDGYFIINEGGYSVGNASLTFVSDDFTTIEQDIFKKANNRALGDTAQSLFLYNEYAYIVVNASDKIEVVNRNTMESVTTIYGEEIKNPRYMVAYNGFGYISNWGEASDPSDDFIAVINLTNNQVSTTIPIGEGPEKLIVANNKIYVALQGGWHQNNKIVVIDPISNTLTNTIVVGDVPNSILKDDLGSIWVLCQGKPSYASEETTGQLIKIIDESVAYTFDFLDNTHPTSLCLINNTLYFVKNGYITSAPIETPDTQYNIHEFNGDPRGIIGIDESKFYTIDAGDYTAEGTISVYDKLSFELIKEVATGIIPNAIIIL